VQRQKRGHFVDKNGEYHKYINTECLNCGKPCKPSSITRPREYCSKNCFHQYRWKERGKYVPCIICGKMVYRLPSHLKDHKVQWCSKKCFIVYNRQNGIQTCLKLASNRSSISKLEGKFKDALLANNISFIQQFRYEYGIADFFVLPNIIVECDGDYWHNLPEKKARNPVQNEWLKSNGYQVYRFSEEEINKDVSACVARIGL